MCRQGTDCYSQASCDGRSPLCPVSPLHRDGTLCHGGIRACRRGRCRESLCVLARLEDCFCTDREQDRCKLCCRHPSTSQCLPADVFNVTGRAGAVIYLPEGDGCLNYRGVCTRPQNGHADGVRYCVTVDSLDGGFSALVDLTVERSARVGGSSKLWLFLFVLPLLLAVAAAACVSRRGQCRQLSAWWRTASTASVNERLRNIIAHTARSRSEICQGNIDTPVPLGRRAHQQKLYPFVRQHGSSRRVSRPRASDRLGLTRQGDASFYMRSVGTFGASGRPMLLRRHPSSPARPTRSVSSPSPCAAGTSDLPPPQYLGPRSRILPPPASGEISCAHVQKGFPGKAFDQHSANNHSWKRRLRANYTKPCRRTPLQRRRTPPFQLSASPHLLHRATHNKVNEDFTFLRPQGQPLRATPLSRQTLQTAGEHLYKQSSPSSSDSQSTGAHGVKASKSAENVLSSSSSGLQSYSSEQLLLVTRLSTVTPHRTELITH